MTLDGEFPHRKQLDAERFAYVVGLTYGRARICVAPECNPFTVDDSY